MILELVEFTGKDWGEKFTEKPSHPSPGKLFDPYQLKHVYYRENQTDHKNVLYGIPCHSQNIFFSSL